ARNSSWKRDTSRWLLLDLMKAFGRVLNKLHRSPSNYNAPPQSAFFPAALAFLQRAFAIADSLALAAALIFLLGCVAGLADVVPLVLAHLALAPAAILERAAALILRFD